MNNLNEAESKALEAVEEILKMKNQKVTRQDIIYLVNQTPCPYKLSFYIPELLKKYGKENI